MQYILSESFLYGSSNFLLNVITITSLLLSLYVIISKNPVISILFLIGLFFSISMYLIAIGLHFIGLSYLLVYIGAVSIFFIFIIMLINIRISELLTDNRNSVSLAILTVLIFNYCISSLLPTNMVYNMLEIGYDTIIFSYLGYYSEISLVDSLYIDDIINVASKSWDNIIMTSSHMGSIGSVLYTNLYILLIIVSLILLLAMVGAIVITMGKSSK